MLVFRKSQQIKDLEDIKKRELVTNPHEFKQLLIQWLNSTCNMSNCEKCPLFEICENMVELFEKIE